MYEDKYLWDMIDRLRDDVNCHIDTITDLQAENEIYRNSRDKRVNMVKDLKAENKRLQAEIEQNRVDNCVRMKEEESKYCDECDEIKELKAELDKEKECAIETSIKNDMLQAENKRLKGVLDMDSSLDDAIIKDAELIRELQAENNRLVEQVSSKWTNNSNVHTIRGEIAEYMDNNDKCGGARLFILPIEDFDGGGICDTCLDWDDGME